jgi:hypothetical protein
LSSRWSLSQPHNHSFRNASNHPFCISILAEASINTIFAKIEFPVPRLLVIIELRIIGAITSTVVSFRTDGFEGLEEFRVGDGFERFEDHGKALREQPFCFLLL